MEALLKSLYYDPAQGLKSVNNLFKLAQAKDENITKGQVAEFLQKQEGYQLTKKSAVNKKKYHPIVGPLGSWQVDLMFYDQYASINSHFGVFLVAVEINTRYLMVIPLKSKDQYEVLRGFAEFYMHAPDDLTPQNILSDNGTEFKNATLRDIEGELTINHFFAEPDDHRKLGCVDRVIRTIRTLIERYMASYDTHRFIDDLPKLVANYNATENSAISMSPDESLKNLDIVVGIQMAKKKMERAPVNLMYDDSVRVLKKKGPFDKGTTQTFSKQIYKIVEVKGTRYTLDNGKTYPYDRLQKIEETQTAPEKAKGEVRKNEEATIAKEKQTKGLEKEGLSQENIRTEPRIRKANVRLRDF